MIPLTLRAEGAMADAPFIVRLRMPGPSGETVTGPWDAVLHETEGPASVFDSRRGRLRLVGIPPSALAGDILLVDPVRSIAHRIVRSASPHNTFLVTEQCDQLCVMCSQPPKERHVDLFALYREAALLAPPDMTIGISGGEPALHKEALFEFLHGCLSARPDLRFHVLTNGQHFVEHDLDTLARLPVGKVLWGVPLYASDPALHDEIVGKEGAFARLMDSFALLARGGAAIELRTVVMTSNAETLDKLAAYLPAQLPFIAVWAIMQLENIGFARMNWDKLFFDSGKSFTPVGTAIDAARARGLNVALYNFPLCTVPEAYRGFACASISDWKQRYLEPCRDCRLRGGCGGFFAWYPVGRGFATVGPV